MSYLALYSAFKNQIGEDLGMTESLLHVHLGLAIFVLSALLLRRRMRSPIPLLLVLVLELANECVDYAFGTGWSLRLSALDVVNTMLWPTVLFLMARRGPAPASDRLDAVLPEPEPVSQAQ